MQVRRRGFVSFAVVATVASAIGVIGVADADLGSGDRPVFVPLPPCRLLDTRPGADNVGTRSTPLQADETLVQAVRGTNGNCTVPTDAIAAAMNVTTLNSTSDSYLTVFPADVARPVASNLNWRAGRAPTPNKVDVKLSAAGEIGIYNFAGQVDVIADVVGYYVPHHHDDRYVLKSSAIAIDPASFRPLVANTNFVHDPVSGAILGNTSTRNCVAAPVSLPEGAVVAEVAIQVKLFMTGSVSFTMYRNDVGEAPPVAMVTGAAGPASVTDTIVVAGTAIAADPVVNGVVSYSIVVCDINTATRLYGATITLLDV